ncbi:class I SAM-dependent methyltransferase [Aliiroseovarius sp. YM-037]|uniref:class I SAM-dependent methyltransferase n=1 Tax=Aliiroseovarius sp. YM-037 TaxID=3341728 RepID=UPI003A7F9203
MSGLLTKFVAANRRAAKWCERQFPSIFASPSYKAELERRIQSDIASRAPKTILEIGGIDRPLLARGKGFDYVGLDIEEKPRCADIYDRFLVQSVEETTDLRADMAISITVLEHVPNNTAAARTIFRALNEGGTTHHYIPSKWHPYSVALRVVGPTLQKKLIALLRPAAKGVSGYPAYFDHCSPCAMERLFRNVGYDNIEVQAFYRASDYFAFFLPIYVVIALFENLCRGLRLRGVASGFVISAERPAVKGPADA